MLAGANWCHAAQPGGRLSMKACTPSRAELSILLQAMVWAAAV